MCYEYTCFLDKADNDYNDIDDDDDENNAKSPRLTICKMWAMYKWVQ